MIDHIELMLEEKYNLLAEHLSNSSPALVQLAEKNKQFHNKQFTYLKRKIEDANLLKHDVKLRKYHHIEGILYPENTLQERWFSPFVFLNELGPMFIEELLAHPFEFNGKHKILTY